MVVVVKRHQVSLVKSVYGYLKNRKIRFQLNYECIECVVSFVLLQAKVGSRRSSPMLTLFSIVALTSGKLRAVWLAF